MKSIFGQTFAEKTSDENQWLRTALQLLACLKLIGIKSDAEWTRLIEEITSKTRKSELLSPGNYQSVHMMLAAFVIENLFKYHLVRNNKHTIYKEALKNSKLPELLNGHDLIKLAESAGYELISYEERLLKRLYVNSTWIGRYPTPITAKTYLEREDDVYWSSSDTREVKDLIDKIIRFIDPDFESL